MDIGCGLQLQRRALAEGSEIAANTWLLSDPVQAMLNRLAELLMVHSLDVERRHAEVKKWESSKLKHIATASRNAMIKRYLVWRQRQCDLLATAQREIYKLTRTNLQALVWQNPYAIRPVGQLFSASRQPDRPDSMSATSSPSSASAGPSRVTASEAATLMAKKTEMLDAARLKMEKAP